METLQTMMDAFGELGGTLIAVIFMLVALLLAGLIVRASQRNEKSGSVQTPKASRHRYHDETAEEKPTVNPVSQPTVNPAPVHEFEPVNEQAQNIPEPITQSTQQIKPSAASDLAQQYDAELVAKKAELANPYPTDSVLRRHYETLHNINAAPAKIEPAVEVKAIVTPKASKPRGSIIEMAINKDEQATPVAFRPTVVDSVKRRLPEDSVLKRHFVQQAQAQITNDIGPKPTDSVLKRHYEILFQQALEKRLSNY